MNNRDPFNRSKSTSPLKLLRAGGTAAASHTAALSHQALDAGQQLAESGKRALAEVVPASSPSPADAMSYALPRNVPSYNDPHRRHEDGSWASSGRSRFTENGHVDGGGMAEKIGGIFNSERRSSLPMYKDKPFQYPASQRRVPWFKRRRVLAALLLTFFGLFYLTGGLSSSSDREGWGYRLAEPRINWAERQERVRDAFELSWNDYAKHAWGFDEYHPVSKGSKQMVPNGMGWIIVDALDTLMLMNLTTEVAHAREWIATNLTYDQNHDVSTFETTIRMLGGLLSAHYLSSTFPDMAPLGKVGSDDLYLEKATDLADRLLGAYDSPSGVPYASVNLHTQQGIPSHDDGGASSTAEATSVQLEMKYLSKLTGEVHYWEKAEKVMQVVDDNGMKDGLLPIFIYADRGSFRGSNIRLGSRGDSYYGTYALQHKDCADILNQIRIFDQTIPANIPAGTCLP